MRLFWMDGVNNYGDLLTPIILNHFGIEAVNDKTNFEAIMVGSIAAFAKPGVKVLGSGFIQSKDKVCPDADWIWVRGPISRKMVLDAGGTVGECYGDPAWILPQIWPASEKEYDIGIVPHYVDYHIAKERHPGLPIVNLLTDDPEKTTKEITKFKRIITSSLHGLIVAHAYGIPAAWVRYSDGLYGDGMKFHDHFASMGQGAILSTPEEPVFTIGTLDTSHMVETLKGLK